MRVKSGDVRLRNFRPEDLDPLCDYFYRSPRVYRADASAIERAARRVGVR